MKAEYHILEKLPDPGGTKCTTHSVHGNQEVAISAMMELRKQGRNVWVEPFYDGDTRMDARFNRRVCSGSSR